MKRFLIAIFISLLLTLGVNYFLTMLEVSEESLRLKINEANYCNSKEDCVRIGPIPCISCDVYVNKQEVKEIDRLHRRYKANCEMLCSKPSAEGEVDCTSNKCTIPQSV